MKRLFLTVSVPICLALVVAAGEFAGAGDLNPPAGPVAPTHKTLTEVEPRVAVNATNTPGDADSVFKISQPGSYYLTGNIQGVAGKYGVEIAAVGVTLDLNGFDLRGSAGSLDGVSATVIALTCIKVFNGSVLGWGADGVNLGAIGMTNCRVEGVLASGNANRGIFLGGDSAVANCSSSLNTGAGIFARDGCTFANCSASFNTADGIVAGAGCTLGGCLANHNDGFGISTFDGCTLSNCAASNNGSTGLNVSSGCAVTNCSAYRNGGSGIAVNFDCAVIGCVASKNTFDGIECTDEAVIRGNNSTDNGYGGGNGAGIHAWFTANRIEGNNCWGADRGIEVSEANNVIIRNTCSRNTIDWVIAANNVFGPIIDRRSPSSAAVSGFSALSSLGSTDANANVSY